MNFAPKVGPEKLKILPNGIKIRVFFVHSESVTLIMYGMLRIIFLLFAVN